MQLESSAIRKYFAKLGLDTAVADIYLALYTYGPQSISQLSRSSKVERTRIYRLVDELMESNLIEVDASYKRGMLKAAPIANLNILINKKEQELRALQDELELVSQVLARNSLSSPAARVQFYYGQEGIKQMLWGITGSKKPVAAILSGAMPLSADSKYFIDWSKKISQNGTLIRSVSNKPITDSWQKTVIGHTDTKLWQTRSISEESFPVAYSSFIYSDVVASVHQKDGEVFGMEIQSKEFADTQNQYFDLLWQTSAKTG